jgi:acetylornithine deacetylase/succinyl-diaminopimelate desuccinylase-like protein
MSQGHKPDEYVSIDQINKCEEILSQLLLKLQTGL